MILFHITHSEMALFNSYNFNTIEICLNCFVMLNIKYFLLKHLVLHNIADHDHACSRLLSPCNKFLPFFDSVSFHSSGAVWLNPRVGIVDYGRS